MSVPMTRATLSNVGFQYIIDKPHTVPDSFTELLSDGVGIADMKWRLIKELQQNSEPSTGSEGPSTVQTADDHKDLLSVYNTIVYGLPHLTLNLPA